MCYRIFRSKGVAVLFAVMMAVPTARAHHVDAELTEPIFTERSFVEKNIEIDTAYEEADDGESLEVSLEANWVFDERFQIGVEVPVGINFPDGGSTVGGLSDVEISGTYLLCCDSGQPLDFLSLRAEVAAPTGDRGKDIGGDGAVGASLLAGKLVTVVDSLPDLGLQVQLGYEQQIRLTNDQLETARDNGLSKTREKSVLWNFALSQNYIQWRLQPVLEVLGTTTFDALESGDEGTIVEIGGGIWWTPFEDGRGLKNLDIAVGAKGPVTGRKESNVTAVIFFDWAL